METDKDYLGDGVYASFDGYQISLSTLEGNRIALEPAVMLALETYVARLTARYRPQADESETAT